MHNGLINVGYSHGARARAGQESDFLFLLEYIQGDQQWYRQGTPTNKLSQVYKCSTPKFHHSIDGRFALLNHIAYWLICVKSLGQELENENMVVGLILDLCNQDKLFPISLPPASVFRYLIYLVQKLANSFRCLRLDKVFNRCCFSCLIIPRILDNNNNWRGVQR